MKPLAVGLTAPPIPLDALLFNFPKGLASFMFASSLVFCGFAGLAVTLQITDPGKASFLVVLGCLGVFGALGTLSMRSFFYLRDHVAVAPQGIWYLPRKGEPTFMAWGEVARVQAKDIQQRLVLLDVTATKMISLEYQLQDFGRLRDFVLQHTAPAAHLDPQLGNVFHRTWINKGILLGGMLIWAALARGSLQHQRGLSLLFVGLAAIAAIAIVRDPMTVVATGDALVVEYLGWQQEINWKSITGITLGAISQRGNVWAVVVVERRSDKPIKLFRFREGSVALYQALQNAWRTETRGEASELTSRIADHS